MCESVKVPIDEVKLLASLSSRVEQNQLHIDCASQPGELKLGVQILDWDPKIWFTNNKHHCVCFENNPAVREACV